MHTVPRRTIFGTYFSVARKYPVAGLLIYVSYAIGATLSTVIVQFYYRDIIDLIAGAVPGEAVWPDLLRLVVTIGVIVLLYNACWRVADFLMVYTQASVLKDLENMALERLQRHSYSFFTGNFTGSLVAKVKRFVRAFETMHDRFTFNFWTTGVELAGVFTVMVVQLPRLAAFFAAWFLVYMIVMIFYVRFRMRFDLREAEADSKVTGALADVVTNILNVKMFTSSREEMERFRGVTREEFRARSMAWIVGNTFHAIQGLAMAVLEVGGIYITLRLWVSGAITAGTVVLVQSYFLSIMRSTWEIGRAMSDFFKALSDASEMVEILELPLEVRDAPSPQLCRIRSGHIRFDAVRFHYVEGYDVFPHFTLDIPAGQKVGIVGHSGGGKSTLFKLILRFLDIQGGDITIDGQDIRSISQDDLRRNISYVPQDPILFHRSLQENIAYAKPGATDEEIREAARRAHAHEFITRLPHGYGTLVGERGVKLSGGERQRVAIARVILKNAPILLLDEATSSLDSVSEKYIQEQLRELMERSTTLAIAHRISTITQMDRIVVLSDGGIVEDGSHAELLEKGGVYAELWGHQSQGFLVE